MKNYLCKVSLFFLLIFAITGCSLGAQKQIYYWQKGDSLQSLATRFSDDILEMRRRNHIYEPEDLFVGFPLVIIPKKSLKQITSRSHNLKFAFPSKGSITSKYKLRNGKFHYGVDFSANQGKEIFASQAGIVKRIGARSSYGNTIEIQHSKLVSTLYAHLDKILVKKNQRVSKSEVIGIMGATGRSTGVHLHFEIIVNGANINPLKLLQ